jgi:hypothetical protein
MLQAAPQLNTVPPAKKRRTQSNSSNSTSSRSEIAQQTEAPHSPTVSVAASGGDPVPLQGPIELGVTFADFPGIPAFSMDQLPLLPLEDDPMIRYVNSGTNGRKANAKESPGADDERPMDRDRGQGSSLEIFSERTNVGLEDQTLASSEPSGARVLSLLSKSNGEVIQLPRKRRRRSCASAITQWSSPCQSFSVANNFLSSTNSAFLGESLLKIYHDSFENALSCWLTERTCPYGQDSEVSLYDDGGPDWNRIYHRVFRLDRLASQVRGRHLTCSENQAASRAINLAIFSFASQWTQSNQRRKSRYPFHSDGSDDKDQNFGSNADIDGFSTNEGFDRTLQISAWHEARAALQNAAEVESFRVVLAQIVFSMTQRPMEKPEQSTESFASSPMTEDTYPPEPEVHPEEDRDVEECEDLLSKLTLTIDKEGPPVHLEQGLRLIHSLRSRMTMTEALNKKCIRDTRPSRSFSNRLDASDRATVDLLFWLGVMFDTLSAAMHKRPLVVSDEDSDIYWSGARSTSTGARHTKVSTETSNTSDSKTKGFWDDHLFARQRVRLQASTVRWPCSYEQAASFLCDAAPVKVLLFRKVTRIQTLLSRKTHGEKIERAVKEALDVYDHWERLYAPFIRDCIESHDDLPVRIQSWYVCLTGHWHLATLLLADLVEIIDGSEFGVQARQYERTSTGFVTKFRLRNCHGLSDLARAACPREDASFPKTRDFHFAMNHGAILTEPWSAVLIRSFAKAGVILLEFEKSQAADGVAVVHQEDAFRRADDCVKALWYLGKKSDISQSAAKILGEALKERRKGTEEKVNDMSTFLAAEFWEGYGEMNEALTADCI